MDYRTNPWAIVATVLITGLIATGIFFVLPEEAPPTEDPALSALEAEVSTLTETLTAMRAAQEEAAEKAAMPKEPEPAPLRSTEMAEYFDLTKDDMYRAALPDGLARLGGPGVPVNVTPPDIPLTTHVWTDVAGVSNLDENMTFYLEVREEPPCKLQEVCEAPDIVHYHGPFVGPVGRMTE